MVIPPESMDNILANLLAQQNLRNLRVAETEKFAHVTYFFNGGIEIPFPGEERSCVAESRDLRPGARDERRWHRRRIVKAVEDTASIWSSSTSPTQTWLATPAT